MSGEKQLNVAIGLRIRQSRKCAGLTQEQLAEEIEVSTQYISDLERGVVGTSIPTLIKICECLSVSSDFLLRGIEQPDLCLSLKFHSLTEKEKSLINEGIDIIHKVFSIED